MTWQGQDYHAYSITMCITMVMGRLCSDLADDVAE